MKSPSNPVGSSGGKNLCVLNHVPSSLLLRIGSGAVCGRGSARLRGEAGSQSIASGSRCLRRVRARTSSSAYVSSSSSCKPFGPLLSKSASSGSLGPPTCEPFIVGATASEERPNIGFAVLGAPADWEMTGFALRESVAKWSCSGSAEVPGVGEFAALASSDRARWADESMRRMGAGRWILMER